MSPALAAARSGIVGFFDTEVHALLGAGVGGYGLTTGSTRTIVAGAAYAVAMKVLSLLNAKLKAAGVPVVVALAAAPASPTQGTTTSPGLTQGTPPTLQAG